MIQTVKAAAHIGGLTIHFVCRSCFFAFRDGYVRRVSRRRQPKLSVKLSASLDAARAVAAGYVVLHHVALARGWANGPGLALRFGDEAVMVFFLLSGFVIFANERTRATRPAGYYLRRLRRIYPALVAALLVSTLIAVDNGTFFSMFSYKDLLGTLASLQDIASLKPGVIVDPYLQNFSLWSLSYEVAFYLAFPLVLRFWLRFPSWADHGSELPVASPTYCLSWSQITGHWSPLISSYGGAGPWQRTLISREPKTPDQ